MGTKREFGGVTGIVGAQPVKEALGERQAEIPQPVNYNSGFCVSRVSGVH